MEVETEIVPMLKDMGVKRCFGPEAEWEGVSVTHAPAIKSFKQKCILEVGARWGKFLIYSTILGG